MHRTTASLLHSLTDPHQYESALNHAMGLGLSTKEPQHHMQLMHFSAPI